MNDENRIRWRCRRGMKELDVMLTRFLDGEYATLDSTTQQTFCALIEESDMDLFAWLTGRSEPQSDAYRTIVDRIRTASPTK